MFVQGREQANGSKFFSLVTLQDLTKKFQEKNCLTRKFSKTWFFGGEW